MSGDDPVEGGCSIHFSPVIHDVGKEIDYRSCRGVSYGDVRSRPNLSANNDGFRPVLVAFRNFDLRKEAKIINFKAAETRSDVRIRPRYVFILTPCCPRWRATFLKVERRTRCSRASLPQP